jgi:outer membrane protein insertion porin family
LRTKWIDGKAGLCGRVAGLLLLMASAVLAAAQALPAGQTQAGASKAIAPRRTLEAWYGRPVSAIAFEGVAAEDIGTLREVLALQPGDVLTAQKIRDSLERLYATGLYRDLSAVGVQKSGAVTVIFRGVPQLFLRRLVVTGVKQGLLTAQLERSTRLEAGVPFTHADLVQSEQNLKETLARNGYHQPVISFTTQPAGPQHLIDVTYHITAGKQATVGALTVSGSPGMTVPKFRKVAKLKEGSKVNANTVPRALSRLRKRYQKQNRLEADVQLTNETFVPTHTHVDYGFQAVRGPLVAVAITGAKLKKRDLKSLVPVYEEGAVDPDLLDEGDDRLRNHFQRQGYFDARVTHTVQQQSADRELITYHVERGALSKIVAVRITGNHYFDKDLIRQRLSVQPADPNNRHGVYSASLVQDDIDAITALYKSNGFSHVRVTPSATGVAADRAEGRKSARVTVTYAITEGPQQRIGTVTILGSQQIPASELQRAMNTRAGEPYSLTTLAGDRLQLFDMYYRKGFSQADITFQQQTSPSNPNRIDITVQVHEGQPFYVHQVLISGIHYTKPQVVNKLLDIHPGDPLDRNRIAETQRRLYNLALFSQVETGIVNPAGEQTSKDVLLNLTEAHRWNYDYGFGFEVQTGTPQRNCPSPATRIELGIPASFQCSPNGKFGASPRVSFDLSRINLRGTNRTLTLQTAYGTLEQEAILTYDVPRFMGLKTFDFAITGGFISNQDVTTYQASSISGSLIFTERPNKANTLIYSMAYRYVYVNPNSLQVSIDLIPLLSQPTRVSGPGITWVRDTRNNPLNATTGSYFSAQQFFAWRGFASQANFNRIDMQQANYFKINRHDWILARSTRIGLEETYGGSAYSLIPLPERLYAGGATSHRGFSINAAGPRDLQTGFPVGGQGAFVNTTELRIPPVPLPLIGDNLGFAIFHDLGNVYQYASNIFPSLLRYSQPNVQTCYNLAGPEGTCDFNYDSQAVGLGLRYKTPVGPIRLDFAYNINPTVYPVVADPQYAPAVLDYNGNPPYVGNSGHFNFFFSIGQSF